MHNKKLELRQFSQEAALRRPYLDVHCCRAAFVASSSARLLSRCDACPFVHDHRTVCTPASRSSSSQRSRFTTGFFSAVIQPRLRQFWIHFVIPFFRYSESVISSTSHGRRSFRSASIAAVSSIRLLVVC